MITNIQKNLSYTLIDYFTFERKGDVEGLCVIIAVMKLVAIHCLTVPTGYTLLLTQP